MTWSQTVKVEFTDARWFWALSDLADKRDVSLGNLLQDLARAALSPERASQSPQKSVGNPQKMTLAKVRRLKELHDMGLTDNETAMRIGVSRAIVAKYRDALGMAPVRAGRRTDAEIARIALIPADADVAA